LIFSLLFVAVAVAVERFVMESLVHQHGASFSYGPMSRQDLSPLSFKLSFSTWLFALDFPRHCLDSYWCSSWRVLDGDTWCIFFRRAMSLQLHHPLSNPAASVFTTNTAAETRDNRGNNRLIHFYWLHMIMPHQYPSSMTKLYKYSTINSSVFVDDTVWAA
jgi:hypothetical protein